MPGLTEASVTSSRTTAMRGCDVDALVHRGGEHLAVDGERAAARNARLIGALEDHRAEQAHLGLEQAVRVGRLGALEGVGADELGEPVGLVRSVAADGTHLVQDDVVPALGELPGGLAARRVRRR